MDLPLAWNADRPMRRRGTALEEIVVVDYSSTGQASADALPHLICRLLDGAGAQVIRISPTAVLGNGSAPDSCRHHFVENESRPLGWGTWDDLPAEPDVVIVRDRNAIDNVDESAVVVVIDEGDFVDPSLPVRSHELIAQAVTGAVFEHIPGRAAYNGTSFGAYGAAVSAATDIVADLVFRLETGVGQRFTVSLWMGVAAYMATVWSGVDGDEPLASIPVGADVPLFRCADGEYICLSSSPRCPNPLEVLAALLELDVDPETLRGTRAAEDLANYFYNYDIMAGGFLRRSSVAIMEGLREADFAAEIVKQPGQAWDSPDVTASGLLESCPKCHARLVGFPIEGI